MQRLTDFAIVTCEIGATIATALQRIDSASPNLFQIVLSADGRVLGTITDGDIRRAILRGATMSDSVDSCMQHTPIVGRAGEDISNRVLMRRARFLPVVDEAGRLDHILIQPRDEQPQLRALVMAGGFGRRLGPLTREVPKPLLPVAGRPILDRVLEQLESAGVASIYVALHYKGSQIKEFVLKRQNVADISFIDETEPLGTAGALAHLNNRIDEPILVINGDVMTRVDIPAMLEFAARHAYEGTIAVARHEIEVPFGVIRQTSDGRFAGIDEKPSVSHFVAAGLYYLSPEFIALTPRGRAVDMPELLTLGASAGLRIGLFPVHEYWKDVGRPGDLAAAHQDYGQIQK
jgi:dTDP-glucose pyrophosphorylase